MTDCISQVVGAWKKKGIIHRDQIETVFLGTIVALGKSAVVKQIQLSSIDEKQLLMIESENKKNTQLFHPNIIQLYGVERQAQTLDIFYEYASGGSLQRILQEKGPLDEQTIAKYTKQILFGLHYLHINKIAHRNIKPTNILLSSSGKLVLMDFGHYHSFTSNGQDANFQGKNWTAPEIIKGEQNSTLWFKSDIWSIGCIVSEMLTGTAPFSQFPNPLTAIYKIANGEKPILPNNISDLAKDFVFSCCRESPDERPNVEQLLVHEFLTKYVDCFGELISRAQEETETKLRPSSTSPNRENATKTVPVIKVDSKKTSPNIVVPRISSPSPLASLARYSPTGDFSPMVSPQNLSIFFQSEDQESFHQSFSSPQASSSNPIPQIPLARSSTVAALSNKKITSGRKASLQGNLPLRRTPLRNQSNRPSFVPSFSEDAIDNIDFTHKDNGHSPPRKNSTEKKRIAISKIYADHQDDGSETSGDLNIWEKSETWDQEKNALSSKMKKNDLLLQRSSLDSLSKQTHNTKKANQLKILQSNFRQNSYSSPLIDDLERVDDESNDIFLLRASKIKRNDHIFSLKKPLENQNGLALQDLGNLFDSHETLNRDEGRQESSPSLYEN